MRWPALPPPSTDTSTSLTPLSPSLCFRRRRSIALTGGRGRGRGRTVQASSCAHATRPLLVGGGDDRDRRHGREGVVSKDRHIDIHDRRPPSSSLIPAIPTPRPVCSPGGTPGEPSPPRKKKKKEKDEDGGEERDGQSSLPLSFSALC